MRFDGSTYNAELDQERLSSLLDRVKTLMLDGQARTLAQIAKSTGGTEASVSARLRDLRKERFGGFTVERERSETSNGLYFYTLKPPMKDALFIEPSGQISFLGA